ncbi:hypothetical protein [Nocardia sp. NBC_00511]|uniref:hypothetical protein n=1 Tax=Nocardia sp. NBC_00511 TaxID=2903591 RepID=UPI0030DF6A8F
MAFMVNGYRLRSLTKDPAAVQDSLHRLAEVLAAARDHMAHIGRQHLADQLADLTDRLQTMGESIDTAFDRDFRAVTDAAATACVEAAGPNGMQSPNNPNGPIYWELAWAIVHVVTIRVGGVCAIEHSTGDLS